MTCECGCGAAVRKRFLPGHNIRVVSHPALKHGLSGTPEYHVWKKIISRCHNPLNRQYTNYGGRGITVCERWRTSLQAFVDDVGLKPEAHLTLDRINNDGNYEPGNVRWTTWIVQIHNRRTPRPETYPRRQSVQTCCCGVTCNVGGMRMHIKATGHDTI